MSPLVATLGWLLAIVATFTAAPQLLHLLKGNKIGIEPLTPAIATTTMVSWVIFTSSIHDLPAFASSVGPLIIWSAMLFLLSWHKVDKCPRAITLVVGSSTILIVSRIFHLLPISSFGIIAASGSTIWALPQLVKVFRLRGQDISGVSFWAYLFLALENAAWILYAIGTGVIQYALAPMAQFPACLAIAIYANKAKKETI